MKKPRGTFKDRDVFCPELGRDRCVADVTAAPGEPKRRCKRPPIIGGRVCMAHGGTLHTVQKSAALSLLEHVPQAIQVLYDEMMNAENKSADRQSAANSILDRAGVSRKVQSPDVDAVKEVITSRLLQAKGLSE